MTPLRLEYPLLDGIPIEQVYTNIIIPQCIVDIFHRYEALNHCNSQEAYQHMRESYELGRVFQSTDSPYFSQEDFNEELKQVSTHVRQVIAKMEPPVEQRKPVQRKVTLKIGRDPSAAVVPAGSPTGEKKKTKGTTTASVKDFPSVSALFHLPFLFQFHRGLSSQNRGRRKQKGTQLRQSQNRLSSPSRHLLARRGLMLAVSQK